MPSAVSGGLARRARCRAATRAAAAIAVGLGAATCGGNRSSEQSAASTAERTAGEQGSRLPTRDLKLEDRRAWRRVMQWPESCERGFHAADSSSAGLEFFTLASGRLLAQVTCSLGAYQPTYVYYVVDAGASPRGTGPLEFRDYVSSGTPGPTRLTAEQTTEVVGLPTFLSSGDRLRVFRRFRGIGDCGIVLTYAIADAGTTLREARGKLSCDGRGPRDPERWPVLKLPE